MKKFEVTVKAELVLEIEAEDSEQAGELANEERWGDLMGNSWVSAVNEVSND